MVDYERQKRMTSGGRRIVVVLGMHRAGTSLLMHVLSRMGLAVGNDLLQGDAANADGYWELRDIYTLQDRILEHIGRAWDTPAGVLPFPGDWRGQAAVQSLRPALAEVLHRHLLTHPGPVGFKDPRTASLLPLWEEVFSDLDLAPVYVLATRDPGAVALSMRRRGFPFPHGLLLWARTYSEALSHAADQCAAIIDYDDWFEDARGVAGQLHRGLEQAGVHLPSPWNPEDGAVKPSLRHWRGRDSIEVPGFIDNLYRALRHKSGASCGLRHISEQWDVNELERRSADWQQGYWEGQRFLINSLDRADKKVSGHGRVEVTQVDEGALRERCIFIHPSAQFTIPVGRTGPAELRMDLGLHPEMRADARAGATRIRVSLDGYSVGEAAISYGESTPQNPWRQVVFALPAGTREEQALTIRAEPADGTEDFHWLMLREPVITDCSSPERLNNQAPRNRGFERPAENPASATAPTRCAAPAGRPDGSLRETLELDRIHVPRIDLVEFEESDAKTTYAPGVTLFVDARHGCRYLRTLLPVLQHQRGLGPISVVVMDHEIDTGVAALAERCGAHVMRGESNAVSSNRSCMAEVDSEYVVMLPDDALPTSRTWLKTLVSGLQRHKVDAVSCRELPRQGAELYGSLQCHYGNDQIFGPAEDNDCVLMTAVEKRILAGSTPTAERCWIFPRAVLERYPDFSVAGIPLAAAAVLRGGSPTAVLSGTAVARSFEHTPYEVFKRHASAGMADMQSVDREVRCSLAYMRALKAALRSADDVATPDELQKAVERAVHVYIPATSTEEEFEAIDDPEIRDLLREVLLRQHELAGASASFLVNRTKQRLADIIQRIGRIYPHVDEAILAGFWGCVQNVFAEGLGECLSRHGADREVLNESRNRPVQVPASGLEARTGL